MLTELTDLLVFVCRMTARHLEHAETSQTLQGYFKNTQFKMCNLCPFLHTSHTLGSVSNVTQCVVTSAASGLKTRLHLLQHSVSRKTLSPIFGWERPPVRKQPEHVSSLCLLISLSLLSCFISSSH